MALASKWSAHLQVLGKPRPEANPTQTQDQTEQTHSYPTASKEREKARRRDQKEAGTEHQPKKIHKHVEHHFDDLGDDLSGLGTDLAWHMMEIDPTEEADAESSDTTESSDQENVLGLDCFAITNAPGLAVPTHQL